MVNISIIKLGIYLSGSEVKIDESAMTGESDEMLKASFEVC